MKRVALFTVSRLKPDLISLNIGLLHCIVDKLDNVAHSRHHLSCNAFKFFHEMRISIIMATKFDRLSTSMRRNFQFCNILLQLKVETFLNLLQHLWQTVFVGCTTTLWVLLSSAKNNLSVFTGRVFHLTVAFMADRMNYCLRISVYTFWRLSDPLPKKIISEMFFVIFTQNIHLSAWNLCTVQFAIKGNAIFRVTFFIVSLYNRWNGESTINF